MKPVTLSPEIYKAFEGLVDRAVYDSDMVTQHKSRGWDVSKHQYGDLTIWWLVGDSDIERVNIVVDQHRITASYRDCAWHIRETPDAVLILSLSGMLDE